VQAIILNSKNAGTQPAFFFMKYAKMKTYLSIITTALLMYSCQKEVKLKLPEPEKKLVVNSLFSPDSVFKVRVSALQGMFDNSSLEINNAEVKLFTNSIFSGNLASVGKGVYTSSSVIPMLGNEYKLIVTAPNYPVATATGVMPSKKVLIEKTTRKDSVGVDEDGDYYSEATVIFTDPIGEKNYYELRVVFVDTSSFFPYTYSSIFGNDPVIENENDLGYDPINFLFSDNLINGVTYSLKFNYYPPHYGESGSAGKYYRTMAIQFNSISEEYYKYKKKLLRHFATQNSSVFEPSEPAQMYSNIEGGYGIFAGYCGVTDTIKK
jgi:Domain of unknown function (DUF4249)